MWHKVRKKLVKFIRRDSEEVEKSNAALAELDDDFRYIPPQQETGEILEKLTKSNTDMLFVYTGSEHDDYTYKGQLFAMFPELRGNTHISEQYLKEADHTLILKSDRIKVTNWVCEWFDTANFSRSSL